MTPRLRHRHRRPRLWPPSMPVRFRSSRREIPGQTDGLRHAAVLLAPNRGRGRRRSAAGASRADRRRHRPRARSPGCGSVSRPPAPSPRAREAADPGRLAARRSRAGIGERFADRDEPRLPVIDARRGEVFAALDGGTGERAVGPVRRQPGGAGGACSPRLDSPPLAAGDGSLRFRSQLEAAGAERPRRRRPGAPAVGAAPLQARRGPRAGRAAEDRADVPETTRRGALA